MGKEAQPKTDLPEIDGPVTPGIAEGADDQAAARRRFIKIGLGVATPIILTVTSRPAWAACGGDLVSVPVSASGAQSCRPGE